MQPPYPTSFKMAKLTSNAAEGWKRALRMHAYEGKAVLLIASGCCMEFTALGKLSQNTMFWFKSTNFTFLNL